MIPAKARRPSPPNQSAPAGSCGSTLAEFVETAARFARPTPLDGHSGTGEAGQAGLVEVPHVTRPPTVTDSALAAEIMQCAAWVDMSVIHPPVLAVGDDGAAGAIGGTHEAHFVPQADAS